MNLDPKTWESVPWDLAHTIPSEPGCYALLDTNETILYIGRSKILWNRLRNPKTHPAFQRAERDAADLKICWACGWDVYDSERSLIKKWKPPLCKERIKR